MMEKAYENAYNDCNNASEPKQPKESIMEQTETMAEIEVGTREALEIANEVLNLCLRTICFGDDAEENNKIRPECLMDLQRYNRELSQRVANKAIKVRDTLTTTQ